MRPKYQAPVAEPQPAPAQPHTPWIPPPGMTPTQRSAYYVKHMRVMSRTGWLGAQQRIADAIEAEAAAVYADAGGNPAWEQLAPQAKEALRQQARDKAAAATAVLF